MEPRHCNRSRGSGGTCARRPYGMGRAARSWRAIALLVALSAGAAVGAETAGAREEIHEPVEIERRLAEAEGPADRAFWQGRKAYLEGDLPTAVEAFREAVARRPDDAAFHFWLGRTYGRQALDEGSRWGQAATARRSRKSFETAVALDPAYLEPRLGLVRFHLVAPALVGGNVEEAHRQAREIARRSPYLGHLAWGAVYEEEENWQKAAVAYRRALRARPEESEPYLRLVWMYQGRKRFEEAFGVLEELRAAAPREPLLPYEIGRTAAFSGRKLEEGRGALERVLARFGAAQAGAPTHAEVLYHLGMIQRHQGENAEALDTFRRALSLDAASAEARRNVDELEALISGE